MSTLAYTVYAEIDTPDVAAAWAAWIVPHAHEVVASGALAAQVVRLDGGPPFRFEMRYQFASREAFAAYERDHAPHLRADGKARFPTVRMTRSLGEILGG